MQSQNQNDGVQLSTRYQQYDFAKRHLGGFSGRQVFPISGESSEDTRRAGKEISYTIDASYAKGTNTIEKSRRQIVQVGTLRTHKDGNGFREVQSGLAPTIPARAREDGSGQPVISIQRCGDRNADTYSTREEAHCLAANPMSDYVPKVLSEQKIRRLTPTECERLMGLQDNWTAQGTEGKISDSQRYKLCGNGVVVNVVEEIIKRLLWT